MEGENLSCTAFLINNSVVWSTPMTLLTCPNSLHLYCILLWQQRHHGLHVGCLHQQGWRGDI